MLFFPPQETLRGSLERHRQMWAASPSSFSPEKLRSSSEENCWSVLWLDWTTREGTLGKVVLNLGFDNLGGEKVVVDVSGGEGVFKEGTAW